MENALCSDPECKNFGKYWRNCGHKPTTRKKSYRIPKITEKQKSDNEEFATVKIWFLSLHPFCAVCGRPAVDVHHSKGKATKYLLLAVKYFIALCRLCHRKAEDNPDWAYKVGISKSRLTKK